MTPMRSSSPHDPLDRDPARDAVLAGELRRHDATAVNSDALRAAIVAGAHQHLTRLESGTADAWWEWTARWGRSAIPIACAAGLIGVAAMTMLALPAVEEQTTLRAPVVAFATVASPAVTGTQLLDSLLGPATHDWVLNGAVSR